MRTRTLPVFPVQRVLVPGEAMVLHVFEERYRDMVAGLEDDRFGMVLIRSEGGSPFHDVGTVARITERRRLGDGGLLLAMLGEERFEIVARLSDGPFPEAVVLILGEGDDREANDLVEQVQTTLRRYLAALVEAGEDADIMIELSADSVEASYEVASVLRLVAPERQELLERPTAVDRLERELMLLNRETELLERTILGF